MSEVVDVRKAEATVEADREKIMSKLGKNCIELNRIVRATCLGVKSAFQCPQIVSAACGDLDVDSVKDYLRKEPAEAVYVAAGGGFLNVVKYVYVVFVAFQNTLTLLVLLCHNHEKMIQHSNTNFRYDTEGENFIARSEKGELHCIEPR